MKKQNYLIASLAILALMAGCKKDQELVTLGAVIETPGKTYINDNRYPCWSEGDQVYVNTAAYPVSAISGSSAQIADVVGTNAYRAILPASLVAAGSNIASNASIPVTLPATQQYQVVDGHQRVDAPMGAYTTGSALQFHNLCSIVHVVVNNNTGSNMTIKSLKMRADNAYLSGAGTATVNGTDDDGITLSSNASHVVTLSLSGGANAALLAGGQSAFDIYVPSFTTDNVTITLTTTNGYSYELTKTGVALNHNTYNTVTLNVDNLTQIVAAELTNGITFNTRIPIGASSIVFEYNSSVSSGTILSLSTSPVPIYGNLDGTVWRVSTSADIINANPDCSNMFTSAFFNTNLNSIDFGEGFNTENVTDMSWMFYGCNSLTSLNLSSFNTEDVTNMLNMFGYCSNLTSLNLSNFNTESVTTMDGMFEGCESLTSIDLSSFNTENVTKMTVIFEGCQSLTSLDLSSFNTENVTDMGNMFSGCENLTNLNLAHFDMSHLGYLGKYYMCYGLSTASHACTITCPLAVQTELQSWDSGLPTSGVTFTWIRP